MGGGKVRGSRWSSDQRAGERVLDQVVLQTARWTDCLEAELIGRNWTREGEGRLAYMAAPALAMWKLRTLGDEDLGKEGGVHSVHVHCGVWAEMPSFPGALRGLCWGEIQGKPSIPRRGGKQHPLPDAQEAHGSESQVPHL